MDVVDDETHAAVAEASSEDVESRGGTEGVRPAAWALEKRTVPEATAIDDAAPLLHLRSFAPPQPPPPPLHASAPSETRLMGVVPPSEPERGERVKPGPSLGIASLSPHVPRRTLSEDAGGGSLTPTLAAPTSTGVAVEEANGHDARARIETEMDALEMTPSPPPCGGRRVAERLSARRLREAEGRRDADGDHANATPSGRPAWDSSPAPLRVPSRKTNGHDGWVSAAAPAVEVVADADFEAYAAREAERRRREGERRARLQRRLEEEEEEEAMRRRAARVRSSLGTGAYRDRVGGGFGLAGHAHARRCSPNGAESDAEADGRTRVGLPAGRHRLTPPELRARYGLSRHGEGTPGGGARARAKTRGRSDREEDFDDAEVSALSALSANFTPPPARGFVGIGGTPTKATPSDVTPIDALEEELSIEAMARDEEGNAAALALVLADDGDCRFDDVPSSRAAEAVAALFRRIDKNDDGVVNIRELILALRRDPALATKLGLPSGAIRQEDGTRDALEAFFQRLDLNDDRELTVEEFSRAFPTTVAARAVTGAPDGEAPAASPAARRVPGLTPPPASRRGIASLGIGGSRAEHRPSPGSVYRASRARHVAAAASVSGLLEASNGLLSDENAEHGLRVSASDDADPATPISLLTAAVAEENSSANHRAPPADKMPPEYHVLTALLVDLRAEASKVAALKAEKERALEEAASTLRVVRAETGDRTSGGGGNDDVDAIASGAARGRPSGAPACTGACTGNDPRSDGEPPLNVGTKRLSSGKSPGKRRAHQNQNAPATPAERAAALEVKTRDAEYQHDLARCRGKGMAGTIDRLRGASKESEKAASAMEAAMRRAEVAGHEARLTCRDAQSARAAAEAALATATAVERERAARRARDLTARHEEAWRVGATGAAEERQRLHRRIIADDVSIVSVGTAALRRTMRRTARLASFDHERSLDGSNARVVRSNDGDDAANIATTIDGAAVAKIAAAAAFIAQRTGVDDPEELRRTMVDGEDLGFTLRVDVARARSVRDGLALMLGALEEEKRREEANEAGALGVDQAAADKASRALAEAEAATEAAARRFERLRRGLAPARIALDVLCDRLGIVSKETGEVTSPAASHETASGISGSVRVGGEVDGTSPTVRRSPLPRRAASPATPASSQDQRAAPTPPLYPSPPSRWQDAIGAGRAIELRMTAIEMRLTALLSAARSQPGGSPAERRKEAMRRLKSLRRKKGSRSPSPSLPSNENDVFAVQSVAAEAGARAAQRRPSTDPGPSSSEHVDVGREGANGMPPRDAPETTAPTEERSSGGRDAERFKDDGVHLLDDSKYDGASSDASVESLDDSFSYSATPGAGAFTPDNAPGTFNLRVLDPSPSFLRLDAEPSGTPAPAASERSLSSVDSRLDVVARVRHGRRADRSAPRAALPVAVQTVSFELSAGRLSDGPARARVGNKVQDVRRSAGEAAASAAAAVRDAEERSTRMAEALAAIERSSGGSTVSLVRRHVSATALDGDDAIRPADGCSDDEVLEVLPSPRGKIAWRQ